MLSPATPAHPARLGAWLLILFGAVWVGSNVGATAWRLRTPIGTWPILVDYDGVATPKVAGHDRLDLKNTDGRSLVRLVAAAALPHETASPRFVGTSRPDTLTAEPDPVSRTHSITLVLRSLGALAMIVLASVLLLRVTTAPIFGFYLFVLGFSPMAQTPLNAHLPAGGAVVQNLLNDVFEGLGLWGIAFFCKHFGARRPTMRFMIYAAAAAALLSSIIADVMLEIAHRPSARYYYASQIFIAAGAFMTLALLREKYRTSTKRARTRMRWIYRTFAVGLPLYLIAYVSDNDPFLAIPLPAAVQHWLDPAIVPIRDLFYLAIVLIPAAVTYAILRHHVMDFGLFVSKGTVFTLLATAIVVTLQGVVSWSEPAIKDAPFLAIFAVALAVSFHPLKDLGQNLIAKFFAKRRTAALRKLRRSARLFSRVTSFEHLEKIMVHRTVKSLDLVGAALMSRDRVLALTYAYRHHASDLVKLASDPGLRDELEASSGAVRLHRHDYSSLGDFHDDIQPLVAIKLRDPGLEFHMFVVGPHRDGTDLDVEEIKALEEFVDEGLVAHLVLAVRNLERRCGVSGSGSPLTEGSPAV
ncbi:MAG TPA: hypothetical protein VIW69_08225 [Candidatus Elarobacter sp.]